MRTRRPGPATAHERGAATVLAVAFLGVLLLVGSALAVVGAMVVAHRTAQSAADLAALAGAGAIAHGDDPCPAAARFAAGNGARLLTCSVTAREVTVEVVVPGPRWLGQPHDLAARARAGPG
jgi:secretion/DNA translocation related TadE-like protein